MAKKEVSCPVEITLEVIFGRWKVLIIHQLPRMDIGFVTEK